MRSVSPAICGCSFPAFGVPIRPAQRVSRATGRRSVVCQRTTERTLWISVGRPLRTRLPKHEGMSHVALRLRRTRCDTLRSRCERPLDVAPIPLPVEAFEQGLNLLEAWRLAPLTTGRSATATE